MTKNLSVFAWNFLALAGHPFSDTFMVRVPPRIHRRLAVKAAESGASLNRLASAKLSH